MSEIKLTKNELREQQLKLAQLQRYLPTLQLKKMMLQTEVNHAAAEMALLKERYLKEKEGVESFSSLLTDKEGGFLFDASAILKVEEEFENIAGADVPIFKKVYFQEGTYALFDTSPWLDVAVERSRSLISARMKLKATERKKAILEKELREVTIRVNLFEKVLIPRTLGNIKKIKVFLGDQELAAVAQAKVAKGKIIRKKKKEEIFA